MIEVDVEKQFPGFQLTVAFSSDAPVTALFGQSGAGKTTLIRMIGGLLTPDTGRIALNGEVLFDSERGISVPPHKRRLGHVFQHGSLFPHMSVRGNLLYAQRFGRAGSSAGAPSTVGPTGSSARGFAAADRPHVGFEEVVELLHLGPLQSRRPHTLSGGEQQRVAIGRALLSNPVHLLMDEPLASLDAAHKREIMPYFERLCHESRVPITYVSHSVGEVARLAQKMVLLSGGSVAAQGPVGELLSRLDVWPPSERREAGSVLEATVVEADPDYQLTQLRVGDQQLVIPRGDLSPGRSVRIRIRAGDVGIALEKPSQVSIQNLLEGTIAEIRHEGGPFLDVRIKLTRTQAAAETEVGSAMLTARITRYAGDKLALRTGQAVYALIKSVALEDDSAPAI